MKNGDLANQVGYTIGFRCVDFLITFKEDKITDKVMNLLVGKEKRAEINESVRNYMEYLYRNTEYNVDLIIEDHDYTSDMRKIIDDLPFNRVVIVYKQSEISQRLLVGDLTLYVDDNDYRRSLINSQYAVSFKQLSEYIKRRGR